MYLIANLPLTLTVKEFIKLVNISQSYEQISSGAFFLWRTVYIHCVQKTCDHVFDDN